MRLILLAALTAAAVGCGCKPAATSQGPSLRDIEVFKPDSLPGEKAKLVLAGTELPVEVKRRMDGNEVVIELWAHGEVVQQERYLSTKDAFNLAMAGGERYDAPLPLLKFPMNVGDAWEWKGQLSAGDIHRTATAKITTSSAQVYVPEPETAVKVSVEMSLDSGAPTPAKRTLTFWLVEGRGVVKREFGAGSTREPG
ncbi:MAG: hypothetical protein M9921_12755 [Fimbriimonadaceae bacterium]|nr:hypothetical protein [Chthonomonadaceae bacterium]MCO5297718.1 hypothetical protein [Fimbriimonadaceae bacterium]